MWNLPRPGIEPVSQTRDQTRVPDLCPSAGLTGRFSTTGLPGKSNPKLFDTWACRFNSPPPQILSKTVHFTSTILSLNSHNTCSIYLTHNNLFLSDISFHSASWQSFWNVMETYTPIELIFSVSKGTPQVLQMSAWNTAPLYSESIVSNFVSVIPNNMFATVLDRPFSVFISNMWEAQTLTINIGAELMHACLLYIERIKFFKY